MPCNFCLRDNGLHIAGDWPGAISAYERAIALDPNLALAYAARGAAANNFGDSALSKSSTRKAYDLRNRLTMPGYFNAEDVYYADVTGDLEEDLVVLSKWAETFPNDFIAHNNLARCLQLLGRFDEALVQAREGVRLFPSPGSYLDLMTASVLANRLDEARAAFNAALAHKFDNADLRARRYTLAFAEADQEAMQQQLDWAKGRPGGDYRLSWVSALAEGYSGRLRAFQELSQRAANLALKDASTDWRAESIITLPQHGGIWGRQTYVETCADDTRDVEFSLP